MDCHRYWKTPVNCNDSTTSFHNYRRQTFGNTLQSILAGWLIKNESRSHRHYSTTACILPV
jgi:hypothetical protein